MKKMRKMMALALAMVMVLAMSMTVFAEDPVPSDPSSVTPDGSITVTNATAGQTYEAYLIFPASPSDPDDLSAGVTYTATAEQIAVEGFDDVFDTFVDADGNYSIKIKDDASDQDVINFVKDNYEALAQAGPISGEFANNTTLTFSNLAYGYYYITSTLGTLVTIDTAGKEVQVVDKNETQPEGPDKEITGEDSSIDESLDQSDVELTENDAAVGSVESFEVTFNATNWVQSDDEQTPSSGDPDDKHKALVWKFKDTPTNLEIDPDSVVVTVNGEDVTSTITDKAVDSTTGALTFNIPWVDDNENFLYASQTAGSALIPVVVTYNATVLEGAAYRTAPNHVEITYDRDDEEDVELGDDTTTTYTWKFKLLKTDENSDPLDGAEFELYLGSEANEDAPALTFTVDDDGNYVYDPEGSVTHIAPTGDNAEAIILGLDNADYMLREVVVPANYNKADDTPVTGLTKETNDTDEASTVDPGTTTIQNLKGSVLPSTGGIGTTIFYVIGAILVIGAGVLLVTRRRMNAN